MSKSSITAGLTARTVQDKHGDTIGSWQYTNSSTGAKEESDGSSEATDSEEEDEAGMLVSTAVDAQIQETLQAIREGDPRIYDQDTQFFDAQEEIDGLHQDGSNTPKPVFLADYQREGLLDRPELVDAQQNNTTTYVQQQHDLKHGILRDIHKASAQLDMGEHRDEDEGDTFLVPTQISIPASTANPAEEAGLKISEIENAHADPEIYLSKYMSARAWVSHSGSQLQPFQSDDEDEDQRADEFEEAYNARFDDSSKMNEKLISHARDIVSKHSVRKEKPKTRQKVRELEREKKQAERQTQKEERARLRKLKLLEAQEKLHKIKETAGFSGLQISEEDWMMFLEEDWDEERWEQEMKQRFGDEYYADTLSDTEGAHRGEKRSKKPKWKEDIDINDLVPPRDKTESMKDSSDNDGGVQLPKRQAIATVHDTNDPRGRKERRRLERMVDGQMEVDDILANFGRRHDGYFRYRETSPLSFGLTAQDILLASDSQLNQHAGLKKMAAFRDPEKKRKDRKRLSKKARIKQWRKDTFGDKQGLPQVEPEVLGHRQTSDPALTLSGQAKEADGRKGRGSKSQKRRTKGEKANS